MGMTEEMNRYVADKLGIKVQTVPFDTDSGAVELLRMMRKAGEWDKWVNAELITTPGALLKAAFDWFKEKP
jgi:hypothetical protein